MATFTALGAPPRFLDEHFGGDEALYREVVALFLEDASAQIEAVSSAFGQADFSQIMKASHRLKGGLKTVGALKAADAARALEAAACAEEAAEVVAHYAALTRALTEALAQLRALLQRP
ncbi:Hpt domain-containing protein [Myxococcota bacterium]|nr:Hpt domain-containing protein [Myxococcota bacterium]MBU1430803.1 Hpt domain-containing protein [Myxococcota bacterium]MBU1900113.1 Hpt domain-containing protein [Myxococcota bacterium]